VVIDCRIERVSRCDKEERVAVRWRAHDCLGGYIGCGAGPVLNDKLLAKPLRQPLAYEARDDVGRATTGREADDDAHRPRRIGLRPCNARDRRQRGSARCQMKKLPPVGKFHFQPPSHHSITSSARASSVGGTSSPSAYAVLRLIPRWYLVGACTGRSAGFSPFRTLRPTPQPNSCSPCRNAARRACQSGSSAGSVASTPILRTGSRCCARAASGHAAAPPAMVINSRRLMGLTPRPRITDEV